MPLFEVDHPWRGRPAEYLPPEGPFPGVWVQNGRFRNVRKKHYHLIWPKDGKNGSKWGRMKDILTNKGPDIHVTIGAEKMDYMYHRPRKPRWALHTELDDRGPDCALLSPFNCINRKRELSNKTYDFRTRKFRRPYQRMWTDARWQPEPNGQELYPEALRTWWGQWYQDPTYVPPEMHPFFFTDFHDA